MIRVQALGSQSWSGAGRESQYVSTICKRAAGTQIEPLTPLDDVANEADYSPWSSGLSVRVGAKAKAARGINPLAVPEILMGWFF